MMLSANAVRALEQVKMGLYMLYGADYFTEEEWIKIDGLIHKGNYVFTRGPPSNILEEPLINFEESKMDTKPEFDVQIQAIESPIEKEVVTGLEEHVSSPASSDQVELAHETPNETSAEASSDEDYNQTQTVAEAGHLFDISEPATPVSAHVEPAKPQLPSNGGLALGYTQAQLDEVKAFNAGLTRAGEKSRPKYSQESYPSPSWTEDETTPAEEAYPSPAPTERETRIHSWASEVDTQEPAPESPKIESPTPNKMSVPHDVLAQEFIKLHGRKPKSTNDFYQPNNPLYKGPKRPQSQTSNNTSKSQKSAVKPVSKTANPLLAKSTFIPGQILVAQSSTPGKGIQMEVRTGDNIKVLKHVSGIMHTGENLRTKVTGQFSEAIVLPVTGGATVDLLVQQQRMIAARKASRSVSSISGISNVLDRVEGINAAEWDSESLMSRSTRAAPSAIVSPRAGLAASRYSTLADMDIKSQTSEQEFIHGLSKEEVGKLFDQKFEQILRAQQALSLATANRTPVPTGPSRARVPLKDPLVPVTPKTSTCYFWATPGKDCRFTADECRDLHAFLPVTNGEPANLRMGKPTWGALADYVVSPSSVADVKPDALGRTRTCWYWANLEGKCNNSAETCRYLHAFTSAGVASRPTQWKKPWDRWGPSSADGTDAVEKESVLDVEGDKSEEGEISENLWGLGEPSVSAWGENPTDKYKPPHIKALEEKAKIEEIGW